MFTATSDLDSIFTAPAISPLEEMGAYEALWESEKASFKTLAETFERNPGKTPSELVPFEIIEDTVPRVVEHLEKSGLSDVDFCVHQTLDYPAKLRDAANPIEFFYYRGQLDLAFSSKSVAVVGTRNPSDEGARRARKLVKGLVAHGYTIFSGLAKGIDTIAHRTAIECDGRTVAVIGTPITNSYPLENSQLQDQIANNWLLISQVPILRYARQTPYGNKFFFPERNATMSALSDATIIVEAGETSGTLTQARAALHQNRKLFILDSCFQRPDITWPANYEKKGAIRVRDLDDILVNLEQSSIKN